MEGPASGQQRVKVYKLNEEGLWDDKGTGHVTVEIMDQVSRPASARRTARAPTQPRSCRRLPPAAPRRSALVPAEPRQRCRISEAELRCGSCNERPQPTPLLPFCCRRRRAACWAACPGLLVHLPQSSTQVGLVVLGESDHTRPLLVHRISKENAYQRQGGERGRGCLPAFLSCAPRVSLRSGSLAPR